MTFATDLTSALQVFLPEEHRVFMRGWTRTYTGPWESPTKRPVALLLHHTAEAATDSTNPKHPGNQRGANDEVIHFVQNHYSVPAANFTLDRDGTVYVHAANPIWHAGVGTFAGKVPWDALEVPANMGNRWMLGVEIVSRGATADYTTAQKKSLVLLTQACQRSCQWPGTKPNRLPRHRDWTTRKVDIVYANSTVQRWIARFGH